MTMSSVINSHRPMSPHTAALLGLDRFIDEVREAWGYVGVAVAIVRGDELLYAQGFGAREIGKPARVDAHTLFQVGSTTKAFTAAALGILVDEGKVRWDDRIIDHLPGFLLQDPWLTRQLTIRDALAHRSGIPVSFYPFLSIMGSEEAVRQLKHCAPQGPFRDSFVYNNLMYEVAGQIVKAASGMTWGELVKRRLFDRLQMKRSATSSYELWDDEHIARCIFGAAPAGCPDVSLARDANVAMPHLFNAEGSIVPLAWQSYDVASAAGTIVSSATEMAQWLILNLNEGRYQGERVLRPETVRELHRTQNLHAGEGEFLFPLDESTEGYAMGWWRAKYRGRTHLAHSGGIIGFPAYMALMPEEQLGLVVLANGPKVAYSSYVLEYMFHKALAFSIFDRLLQAPPRDWSHELLRRMRRTQELAVEEEKTREQARRHGTAPSLALEQYVGAYEDTRGKSGPVSVGLREGQLTLSFVGQGAYAAVLQHWHQDVFRLRSAAHVPDVLGALFASFTLGSNGSVSAMSIEGAFGGTFNRI